MTVGPNSYRAVLREAIAFGLELRHKKGCDWASPASNFQKNKPCSCGRDALYSKLNAAAFNGVDGPNYRQLIEEHNQGCDASCKAQRPSDLSGSSTGCGYQRINGTLIYNTRRCPNCPQDWKIELPPPATHDEGPK